jgi:hypothetical protein
MYSIIGRLAMGTIGFGMFAVSGASLVPNPPAIITAFILLLRGWKFLADGYIEPGGIVKGL